MHDNYLRFLKLRLRDYKIFGGLNDLQFNQHQTFIVGKGGTGKTIIVKTIENLGSPKIEQGTFTMRDQAVSSLVIVTKGNCDLIKKYRSFIFLNRESFENLAIYSHELKSGNSVPNRIQREIESKTRSIFQRILSFKPWKINLHSDYNVQVMAAGERICLNYAFIFAVREALELDVPVVFDSPYAMLDEELRQGMRNFLKAQPCQQILFGHECEFLDEEIPKYILVYVENHSHVMEY